MHIASFAIHPAAVLFWATTALAADPILPVFDPASFARHKPNPYVSLEIGARQILSGTGTENGVALTETTRQIVTGPGPELMGVQTTQILDEALQNGKLVERSFDYYATDIDGNLWYFGEEVTNYRYDAAGNFTGTDTASAWRAGVNGAQPGIAVPGKPEVGLALFQEHAPADKATDYFEVVATDAVVTGPGGSFDHVLQLFETSQSEPDMREFKFFARSKGLVRAESGLSPAQDNPTLVVETLP